MSQFQYFWSSLYNVMSCVLYEFTVLQKYEGNICISEHLMMDKNEIILYFDVNSLGFLPFLSIHDSSLQIEINLRILFLFEAIVSITLLLYDTFLIIFSRALYANPLHFVLKSQFMNVLYNSSLDLCQGICSGSFFLSNLWQPPHKANYSVGRKCWLRGTRPER